MIRVFVYKKENGLLVSEFVGAINEVLKDVPTDCDFTLKAPENYRQPWYWYDNTWQVEPKPTP